MVRAVLIWLLLALPLCAAPLTRAELEPMILAPYALGEPVGVAPDHHDLRPGVEERAAHGPPDASRGAEHDRHPPVEAAE